MLPESSDQRFAFCAFFSRIVRPGEEVKEVEEVEEAEELARLLVHAVGNGKRTQIGYLSAGKEGIRKASRLGERLAAGTVAGHASQGGPRAFQKRVSTPSRKRLRFQHPFLYTLVFEKQMFVERHGFRVSL